MQLGTSKPGNCCSPLHLREDPSFPRSDGCWMKEELTALAVWNTACAAWRQSSRLWMLITRSVYSLGVPFLFSLGLPVSEALLMYVQGKNSRRGWRLWGKAPKCVGRLWFMFVAGLVWFGFYSVSLYFFSGFSFLFTLPR